MGRLNNSTRFSRQTGPAIYDAASQYKTFIVVEDCRLARGYGALGLVKGYFGLSALYGNGGSCGPVVLAYPYLCAERTARHPVVVQQGIAAFQTCGKQGCIVGYYDAVPGGIQACHVQRNSSAYTKAAALADGVMYNAVVPPKDLSCLVNYVPGFLGVKKG